MEEGGTDFSFLGPTPGPAKPVDKNVSPLDLFSHFFTDDV